MRASWWPTALGIALALFLVLDSESGSELAPILAASGLVYLGAAALQKPSSAWPIFLLTFVVIGVVRAGLAAFDATWVFVALAVLLAGYGVLRGGAEPFGGLPLQSLGMVVVASCAAIGATIEGRLGAGVVAIGLLGHAGWDMYHHRVDKVVTRSMAKFCGVLDTLLALSILVATLRG